MKKLALLLVMIMVFTSLPVLADDMELSDTVFDYSQDFSGGKPDDGVFYIVTGYCDVSGGALRTKMNWTGGWSDLKVESSSIGNKSVYAEVTANILGDLSFRMSTANTSGTENSYIDFDGSDSFVKTADGRKLGSFSTGKNTIGININYAEQKADIYLNGSVLALDVDWDAQNLKSVHYRWQRLTGTNDIRPSIDDVLVTCSSEKLKPAVDADEYVTDVHTAVNSIIYKTEGYAYVNGSNLAMKVDGNSEYGFYYNFSGKTTPYVYAKFKADILANSVLKFGVKNTYDNNSSNGAATFTEKISIDPSALENNIKTEDGTAVGSYDFTSKGTRPTIEVLADQSKGKCSIWITGSDNVRTLAASDVAIGLSNISKFYIGWKSNIGSVIRPELGAVTFCGSKKYLPVLSYSQDFQCAEMPNDGVMTLVDYSYLENGVLKSKVKASDNVGVNLSKNGIIPESMYLCVTAGFTHDISFKITAVSNEIQSTLVLFNGEDGKIYDSASKVIGTFDNTLPAAERKIELYSIGGKNALVVGGKLISTEIEANAETAQSIGLKWSNNSERDLRPYIDNIVLTEKEEEFEPAHLVTDPYIDGDKIKVGALNNDETKNLIIAKYNDTLLESVEINDIAENNGIDTFSFDYTDGKVFLWNNMMEIKPISSVIGE